MFDLEAHDVAFDGDESGAQSLTQAKWHGTTWNIGMGGHARGKQKQRALVRQIEGRPILYGCSTTRTTTSYDELNELSVEANDDMFGLRMIFADTMAKSKWARGLFLNDNLKLRSRGEEARWFLLLSPFGWGVWRDLQVANASSSPQDRKAGEGEFLWADEEQEWLKSASASHIMARFESLCEMPEADVHFARTFASQTTSQRHNHLWNWKRGNADELARVLRLAFLSQEELWRHVSGASWEVDPGRDINRQWRGGRLHSVVGGSAPDTLPGLKSALLHVLEWFGPQRNTDLEHKHLSLKRLAAATRQWHINIEAREPSAHERLEAMLEWRAWLEETGGET